LSGDLTVQHLDLAPILSDRAQRSDITGDAKIDIAGAALADPTGWNGTLSTNARVMAAGYVADRVDLHATLAAGRAAKLEARVFASGADATTVGFVSLPAERRPIRFDLRGRAGRVNLRALPKSFGAPPAVTNLNAHYHVVGVQPVSHGQSGSQLTV